VKRALDLGLGQGRSRACLRGLGRGRNVSEGIKTEAPEVCGTLCARGGKTNLARENNFCSDRMGVKDQPSQAKFISGLWENVK
jgi:hypothetical protein